MSKARGAAFAVLLALVLLGTATFAGSSGASRTQAPGAKQFFGPPDLYIKDTPLDTGIEANPDTGAMWVSDDIWVRNDPDPGYQPYPFPEGSPPWIPLANESPEYRDPKFSKPNYVYVRVRNRGTSASTGTERLRLYFAKASTGLSWPTQWVDYISGAPPKLYGQEVTKPRQNAGTATPAQRSAYSQAVVDAGTLGPFVFPGGLSYWHKQQEVHRYGPANRHGTPAFLAWHREFINRYETLLRETNPLVKLLYWDWTTDPENTTGGTNLFTSSFMGASGRGTGGVSIGAPFMPALAPPTVMRQLSSSVTPPATSDATVFANGTFPLVANAIEASPNHNSTHGYIGGVAGDMSYITYSTQDPFFFLLHANVDRLWAQWQRNVTQLGRLDPATAYGTYSANVNITTPMAPWNGTGPSIQPWTIADGYIVSKTPKDPSVVSPPVYDTAPVVVPVLQPGEAAVIQIPWYPPNPADFASFGGDQGHFCLLARVETSTTPPFGMTTPEGTDVYTNTRNNNNIAWKNVTVVDNFAGALIVKPALIRNVLKVPVRTGIRFAMAQNAPSFFEYGHIAVDLKPELYKRWVDGGAFGQGIERGTGTTIRIISPDASIGNILLEPDEVFSIDAMFQLNQGYKAQRGIVPKWDIVQVGNADDPNAIVGGQRYDLDFQRLVQIRAGAVWSYLDGGVAPPVKWEGPDFDAIKNGWKTGPASLGYGDDPVTTIDGGPVGKRYATTYFRHTFEIDDPGFLQDLRLRLRRDDGAVVYLNGTEIHRVNLPQGTITQQTPATRDVNGLEREVFFPVPVDPALLHQGTNVIAVEVHVASPKSNDLSFDLELTSNAVTTTSPPDVAFVSPADGALFQLKRPIPIEVEALDTDGQVGSVSFYADGVLLGTDTSPPYSLQWQGASLGPHRLRAVAIDNDQEKAVVERTVSVLANTPPTVELTAPADGTAFRAGKPILAAAEASDEGGSVTRVEFYLRRMELFTDPSKLVDRDFTPPYTARITGVAPGEYMLEAMAVDNLGQMSPGLPAMIMVDAAPPVTTATFTPSAVNGWFSNPTITLSATDEDSGVDSTTYALDGGPETAYTLPLSVSNDGTHTLKFFSTDMAGNVEQTTVVRFQVDSHGPTVTITAPADGASYHQGKAQPAKYQCSDGFSGVASCKGTVPNGANVDTSTPGSHVFTVVATDKAGNTRTVSHTYQVR